MAISIQWYVNQNNSKLDIFEFWSSFTNASFRRVSVLFSNILTLVTNIKALRLLKRLIWWRNDHDDSKRFSLLSLPYERIQSLYQQSAAVKTYVYLLRHILRPGCAMRWRSEEIEKWDSMHLPMPLPEIQRYSRSPIN